MFYKTKGFKGGKGMRQGMNVEAIRKDFPILQEGIDGRIPIYFDNACSTLKPIQIIEAMSDYYRNYPACGSRSIHKMGTKVTMKCDEAREKIQRFLNAQNSDEIVFTRNTTEGINLVAWSFGLKKGDIVLTTDKEHNSNLVPWHQLARRIGIAHKVVPSNKDETFSMENFENLMSKKVKLVSMAHTSNLDGYTIPAKDIIKVAHDYGALVMLDGAQSAPHQKVDVKNLDVDFFTFSLHKMLGPSGMGVLYGKYDLLEEMNPFLVGGDTVSNTTYEESNILKPPKKFEGGLQNYAGMIGSGATIDYLVKIGMENIEEHEKRLNSLATNLLKDAKGLKILGPKVELRGGILSFVIRGLDPHDICMMLDEVAGIMIRSGMHCVHSWFNSRGINGSARASFYVYNTEEEVRIFAEQVDKLIEQFS